MTSVPMTQASVVENDAADGPYLQVEDLKVTFPTQDGPINAVSGMSYTVDRGKTLGIVGESGSGKSVSSMAVMGLHDAKSAQISGSIRVGGTEVVGLSESRMRALRGSMRGSRWDRSSQWLLAQDHIRRMARYAE